MTVGQDLLAFSKTCPEWQRDLIRRIYTQPELKSTDLPEVLQLLRAEVGLPNIKSPPKPAALEPTDLPHTGATHNPTVLVSIGDVKNAAQLASAQTLPFAVDGITIVYGENGSGKTGYGRLLKGACRARRDKVEKILGDVFATVPPPPAEAKLRYKRGAEPVDTVVWRDGDPGPDALARISVFDAAVAPLYADEQNEIEYLPQGLDVLPRLAEACEVLKTSLTAEKKLVEAQCAAPLPAIAEGTPAGVIVSRLQLDTLEAMLPAAAEITAAAAFNEADQKRLTDVQGLLSSDPALLAARCRRIAAALQTLKTKATAYQSALSAAAIKALSHDRDAANAARAAAAAAAAGAFDGLPLSGVGGDTWRLMFKYACEFYRAARPEETFVGLESGQPCPMCQQPLTASAHDTMCKFQKFIENAAGKEAELKQSKVDTAVKSMADLVIPPTNEIDALVSELGSGDDTEKATAGEISAAFSTMRKRRVEVLALLKDDQPISPAPDVTENADWLQGVAAAFETKAIAYENNAADPNFRVTLEQQEKELGARAALKDCLAAALARRTYILEYKKLQKACDACETLPISKQNSVLRDKYITGQFRDRLKAELRALGLEYLRIKVDAKTAKGKSLMGPALETPPGRAKSSKILSEGEFRGLALACFFAEIGGFGAHDGIIIDDPVSSLDYHHTRQVAERLIVEAKNGRQVIVFTHELTFYYELWVSAVRQGVKIARHWIRRTEEHGFGTVFIDDAPWQAKNVKERIVQLKAKWDSIDKTTDKAGETYRNKITDFYTGVRETWERLVEENLFNGVVGRFQPGVQTLRLSGVEVTDPDYKRIYVGMSRASEHSGHDGAVGKTFLAPTVAAMRAEITELETFASELRKRADAKRIERQKLEKPEKATTI